MRPKAEVKMSAIGRNVRHLPETIKISSHGAKKVDATPGS